MFFPYKETAKSVPQFRGHKKINFFTTILPIICGENESFGIKSGNCARNILYRIDSAMFRG